jgi:hypothetical protein
MASTSTNKQPLLVDHVMHVAVDLNPHKVTQNTTTPGSVTGANTAVKLIDSIAADGCVVESMYTISRGAAYKINLFLSTSGDYLRPEQSIFIAQITSEASAYSRKDVEDLPKVLAPVAHTGSESQLRALYIPKGRALWAGIELDTGIDINVSLTDAPILGLQGGWY